MMRSKFEILGVAERFELDREALDQAFRERSRVVHPDRFAGAPAAERLRAVQASTELNDAYRTLRDPVKRAEHLLALRGAPLTEKESVEQGFLVEILELREQLGEAKAAGDTARLAQLEEDMRARHRDALARAGELLETGGDLAEVKRQVVALRYFQRYLDELDGVEAA